MQEKKDRVKMIREDQKLSQAKFGIAIGVGQRAVGHIETGINQLSPRNAELICQKFNVNPRWLETGEGEMYNPPPKENSDFLDLLAKEKGLTDEEKALIGSIIDLPPEARKAVIAWAMGLTERMEAVAKKSKENRKRELKKTIADSQKELAELESLEGGESPYEEDTSTETG